MEDWKRIIPRAVLLMAMVPVLNQIYKMWTFEEDMGTYSELGQLCAAVPDSTELLYLGESSEFTMGDLDIDKRSTSQFLGDYFPKLKIAKVAKGALHAGNFAAALRMPLGGLPRLHTVVVSLNLRSLGPGWIHSKLETALQEEMVMLRPMPAIFRRLALSLKAYDHATIEERESMRDWHWAHDSLGMGPGFPYGTAQEWNRAIDKGVDGLLPHARNAGQVGMACHFVKNFGFRIDPATNPRIADLDRIVALSRKKGWRLVLNLLPENLELAGEIVGPELPSLMRQNRDLLKERYGREPGVVFVDQLEALPDNAYLDRDFPNEHYAESGRRQVAKGVAEALRPLLSSEYKEPPAATRRMNHYWKNDCEGGSVWSQMQTLDGEHAHNGKGASRTGGNAGKFGITFTYPISALDSNSVDSLVVRCWVYAGAANPELYLAWEAGGEKTGYLWDSWPIRAEVGRWQELEMRVALWDTFRHAEVFKVYPYNKGGQDAWFDDIEIALIGGR